MTEFQDCLRHHAHQGTQLPTLVHMNVDKSAHTHTHDYKHTCMHFIQSHTKKTLQIYLKNPKMFTNKCLRAINVPLIRNIPPK